MAIGLRERHEIDWIQITAGKWKRTVDPLSEITEEQRAKAQEDLGAPRCATVRHG